MGPGQGPRKKIRLVNGPGSDMEKPNPLPFLLVSLLLTPSLSPPRPSLLIVTTVIWVCVGYGWACSYEFGGYGFRGGG